MAGASKSLKTEIAERTRATAARVRKTMGKLEGRHKMTAVAAGFGLGVAEGKGVQLPTVAGADPALTYGVGALIASNFIKGNKVLDHASTGLLAVAAYKAGKGESILGAPGDRGNEDWTSI